jgi:glycine/D-amino acid oxidase-like deaminating enzyme
MNIDALQAYFVSTFRTKQVRVRESDAVVTVEAIEPAAGQAGDCAAGLRGMFADCPELSVDKFLERRRADKELDLLNIC